MELGNGDWGILRTASSAFASPRPRVFPIFPTPYSSLSTGIAIANSVPLPNSDVNVSLPLCFSSIICQEKELCDRYFL
ncbi:MAG: hypothetical protein RMZ69_08645 [Nostoc sp. ChiQUE01a]|nr:hypothetical protein [Nostoc sp. ChiQUE01a]